MPAYPEQPIELFGGFEYRYIPHGNYRTELGRGEHDPSISFEQHWRGYMEAQSMSLGGPPKDGFGPMVIRMPGGDTIFFADYKLTAEDVLRVGLCREVMESSLDELVAKRILNGGAARRSKDMIQRVLDTPVSQSELASPQEKYPVPGIDRRSGKHFGREYLNLE